MELQLNSKNCEFCGSLFVRAEYVGYDISKKINNNELNIVFDGLKEALDQNILNQKKYSNLAHQIGTNVFSSKSSFETDSTNYFLGIWNTDYENEPIRGEISVVFEVAMLTEKQKLLMCQLEEFKLFDDVDADGLWQIHFGNDTIGAAFIISKILNGVFGIDYSTNLYFYQQVYLHESPYDNFLDKKTSNEKSSSEIGSDKGSCFIATATMGSYDHPYVMELRNFRDNWILEKKWGKSFVTWYYHYGSITSKFIEKSFFLKKISFLVVIKPLVYLTRSLKK